MKITIRSLEYFAVFFTILSFSTIYAHALVDYHLAEITTILVLLLLLVRIGCFRIKKRILKNWIWTMIAYFVWLLPVMFFSVSTEKRLEFVEKFFLILPIYILLFAHYTSTGQTYHLFWRYVRIMTVLAAISLFFWYTASIMRWIHPTSVLVADWGGLYSYPNYLGVYTERQYTLFFGKMYVRDQGIFCEAPMYGFCLSLAIAIRIFLPVGKSESRAKRYRGYSVRLHKNRQFSADIIILCAALISTVTTTGMIILILIFVMRYVLQKETTNIGALLRWISAIILAFIGLYVAIQIFIDKSTSGSWLVRADDFVAGFKAWKSSPIFGTGFQSYAGIDRYRSTFRFQGGVRPGYSNGIVLVLAQGGLSLFTVYLIPIMCGLVRSLKKRDFGLIAFTFVFLIEFTFSLVPYTLLILFFLGFFYGTYLESKEHR